MASNDGAQFAPGTPGAPDGGAGKNGNNGNNGNAGERPGFLPEKFWNAETGSPDLEGLSKSYTELEKKFSTRNDDLKKQLAEESAKQRLENRPETADNYEIKVPDGILPDGMTFDAAADNPLMQWWRGYAYEAGLDQEGFNAGIAAYVRSLAADLPDRDAEIRQLGSDGHARVEAVDLWVNSNVDQRLQPSAKALLSTAEGVQLLEALIGQIRGDTTSRIDNAGRPGVADGALNEAEVLKLQKSDAYWAGDPAVRRKVVDWYSKQHPGTVTAGT